MTYCCIRGLEWQWPLKLLLMGRVRGGGVKKIIDQGWNIYEDMVSTEWLGRMVKKFQ